MKIRENRKKTAFLVFTDKINRIRPYVIYRGIVKLKSHAFFMRFFCDSHAYFMRLFCDSHVSFMRLFCDSLLRKGNIKLDSSFTGVKVDVEPADASCENTPDGKGAAGTSGNKDVHSLRFAND
jgi:hypothetical protein